MIFYALLHQAGNMHAQRKAISRALECLSNISFSLVQGDRRDDILLLSFYIVVNLLNKMLMA